MCCKIVCSLITTFPSFYRVTTRQSANKFLIQPVKHKFIIMTASLITTFNVNLINHPTVKILFEFYPISPSWFPTDSVHHSIDP